MPEFPTAAYLISNRPTIYVEQPWTAQSRAVVTWSMPKGGLPSDVAERQLVRLIEVRAAIRLLEDAYDRLIATGRMDELATLLIIRVQAHARLGDQYIHGM